MNIKDYVERICFSISPNDGGVLLMSIQKPSLVDMHITSLPDNDFEMKQLLTELLKIPRMSTFAIGVIINKIVSELKDGESFVNVGVWHGFTFLSGMIGNENKNCIGIDNFSQFGGPKDQFLERFNRLKSPSHEFYEMDYRQFFEIHKPRIGFYIYDGEHSRENQKNGLLVAEPFFNDDCMVLIDDINFQDVVPGTNDFFAQAKYRYEEIFTCRTANEGHPTFWNGITLFKRR